MNTKQYYDDLEFKPKKKPKKPKVKNYYLTKRRRLVRAAMYALSCLKYGASRKAKARAIEGLEKALRGESL